MKSAKSESSPILSDSSVGKSSLSNNKFSNKEFVYGDSDDEETLTDSKESLKNSEMFEPIHDTLSEAAADQEEASLVADSSSDSEGDDDDLNLDNLSEFHLDNALNAIRERNWGLTLERLFGLIIFIVLLRTLATDKNVVCCCLYQA